MNETLSAGDGDRFGDRCESKWTQLTTTQTALQSLRTTQKHPNSRVVVPAAAGSSPVAHPSRKPRRAPSARGSVPRSDEGCEVQLDLRVEGALVVAEAGFDLAAEVVDDRLGLAGLDGVERGGGHGGRLDLVAVERGGEVRVDEADVDGDDVRALALEFDACGVGEVPGRGFRCGVGRQGGAADP